MSKRNYHQYCSIAHALDMVGERWTLLIVRELLMGPKRFTDLLNNLPGMGTNLLATRLKDMEDDGILERKRLPPPSASAVYGLTELGQELEHVIRALYEWGSLTHHGPKEGDRFRPGWSILAMQYAFRPELAQDLNETYEYRIGEDVFHARISNGSIETKQSPAENPDMVITTAPDIFEDVVLQKITLVDAVNQGKATVDGGEEILRRSAEIFGISSA